MPAGRFQEHALGLQVQSQSDFRRFYGVQTSPLYVRGDPKHAELVPSKCSQPLQQDTFLGPGKPVEFGDEAASYTWHVGNIIVNPSLWAAWEHEYKYSNLPITFSSAVFPGASATVFGPHEGHDSAIINAGVGTQWTARIATYVGYQGQVGRITTTRTA